MLLGFFVAMSVTAVLIPPLIKLAGRGYLLDQPGDRKVHSAPVPRVGGIAMAIGLLLALALALGGQFDHFAQAFVAGIVMLLVFGAWDDWKDLSPATKFLGQALAAVAVMAWGGVCIASITLTERLMLPWWLAYPLTFVFLVGVTNAVNLSDGLDGLAGGTTLLCLGAVALLAYFSGNTLVVIAALAVVGAVLGFLRFNTHPARVFMGDSGSQILGFSAAVLTVVLTQDSGAPLSAALPLLLLGLPIIDTLMVISDRLAAGKSPFRGDRNHIHHRLLELGLSHSEAVTVLYLGQALLFVVAWSLRYHSDVDILAVFIGASVLVLATLRRARFGGWRWHSLAANHDAAPGLERLLSWLHDRRHLFRWSYWTAAALLALYAGAGLAGPNAVTGDLRWLAAAACAILLGSLIWRWRKSNGAMPDKAGLYVCAVLAAYLWQSNTATMVQMRWIEWLLLGSLAAATVCRFCLSYDRRLQVTTLDVLIIVIAVLVPTVASPLLKPALPLGSTLLRAFVLFYALEALLQGADRHWRWLSVCGVIFCAAILRLTG